MLFLKDTDGDDKADVRQILSTGWGIRDTHAGPSNLQYGPDNYIWGSVGYSGFDGEMNGKKLQFTQGAYRFKPDGSGFEYVTMSTNNTWGLGLLPRTSTCSARRRTTIPASSSRFRTGSSRASRACRRRAAAARAIRARRSSTPRTTPRRTSARWTCSGGYTAGGRPLSLHRALVPEGVLEPHRLHHRADRAPRRSGHHRVEGRRLRDARRLEPALGRRGMGRAGARAGRARRRRLGRRLVQLHRAAQSDADGLQRTARGNAYEQPLRDHSRGRIYRVVYKHAPAAKKRSLSTTDRRGCSRRSRRTTCSGGCTRSGCSSSAGRRTSCRSWSRSCATSRSTRSGPTAARSTRSGRCRASARQRIRRVRATRRPLKR